MSEQEQAVQTEQATPEANTFLGSEGSSDNLSNDWKSQLPDDLANDPTLQNFKSPADLAKTVVHQQKQLGSRIPMPKNDEERAELYSKLGRPDEAGAYEIKIQDGMESYFGEADLNEFRNVAFQLGLSQAQVSGLIDYQHKAIGNSLESEPDMLKAQAAETIASMKQEWGYDYDKNMRAAKRAMQVYGDDEIMHLVNNTSAGNDPAVIRMFARIGETITEDMAQNTQNNSLAVSPLDAKSEIEAVYANPKHPYFDPKHPEHKQAVARVQQLHEKAYGV
mgnify:FL=1